MFQYNNMAGFKDNLGSSQRSQRVQSNALLVVLMAGMFSLYRAALMRSAQNCPLPVASPRKLPIRKFSRDGPPRTVSPLKRSVKSKEAGKSKSDTGLVSSFRNLSISPKPHPPPRSKSTSPRKTKSSHVRRLSSFAVSSVEDIANLIKEEKCKNVIIMAGAGISTPSGIPDFRSPGTGLYDNLQQYKIPEPTAIFDLDYFWYDPRPFFCLAKSLYPGNYQPNYVHYFVKLLNDKGLLLRMYTQNIDGLERLAEVPAAKLVEAHGTFSTASCIRCHQSYDGEQIKATIMSGDIPRCSSPRCSGVIKPDIVFFGEDLPKRFYCYHVDFPKCDLLLIMGTSLEVEPFAGIASAVDRSTPRLLVNREVVGPFSRRWERRSNDVVQTGDVVEGIKKLVDLLGWSDSMDEIVNSAKERWKQPSLTDLSDYKKVSGEVAKDIGNVRKDISANGKNATANEQGITKNPKPPVSKNFHSNSSGFPGKDVLCRTDRNLLFRRKGVVMSNTLELHRVPLLPFRYTQRNDMSTEDRSKDFKTIDPGKDLASAGFGLGKRSFGLSCFLAGTSNGTSSSSSDDDN